jgi:hypothetical protein
MFFAVQDYASSTLGDLKFVAWTSWFGLLRLALWFSLLYLVTYDWLFDQGKECILKHNPNKIPQETQDSRSVQLPCYQELSACERFQAGLKQRLQYCDIGRVSWFQNLLLGFPKITSFVGRASYKLMTLQGGEIRSHRVKIQQVILKPGTKTVKWRQTTIIFITKACSSLKRNHFLGNWFKLSSLS